MHLFKGMNIIVFHIIEKKAKTSQNAAAADVDDDDDDDEKRTISIHNTFSDVVPSHLAEFFNTITHVNFTEISLYRHVINDDVLSAIRINNPSLCTLEYEFCKPTFQPLSLKQFGESCPNLHTFSMAPVRHLNDGDFSMLFANKTECAFKNIHFLRLSENDSLTEETMYNMLCNNGQGGMSKLVEINCFAMSLFADGGSVVNALLDSSAAAASMNGATGTVGSAESAEGSATENEECGNSVAVTAKFHYDVAPYSTLDDGYVAAGF